MKFKKTQNIWLSIMAFVALSAINAIGQNSTPLIESKFPSKLMKREMSYRVVLPPNYSATNSNIYPTIYLLHGLTGSYKDWTDRTKIIEYARQHNFVIVTPDGSNGWYSDSPVSPNDKFESYIIQELIPLIEKTYRTGGMREKRAIAGLSMGGYGSIKFGLKYPDLFRVAGSFSGALRAPEFDEKTIPGWKLLTDSVGVAFGAMDNPARNQNDIYKMLAAEQPKDVKSLPFIYLDCGTEDFLLASNREFMVELQNKKVTHEYRELPGRHDWIYWNEQVEEFLDVADKYLK